MSNPTDDGGPAFPVEVSGDGNGGIRGRQTGNSSGWEMGMTLRDYFAAKAMIPQRLLLSGQKSDGVTREAQLHRIASDAYAIADAMLAARKPAP